VRVVARGYQIKVTGAEKAIAHFQHSLQVCQDFCIRNNRLSEQDILMLLHGDRPQEQATDNLILHGVNGKSIYARSVNQQALVKAYAENDLLFAVGPAGSGKTYTAIALAVRALKNREVRRIILSRPAVEAGEKLGFLPGDMKEKIDPYLQPLYDALQDMIPATKLAEYMEKGTIQIAPLAFMRGRTLSDAVVILDEAQNTTALQLKMFLTRLGFGSKMIVTGDMTQIDLPPSQKSGLRDAMERFRDVKGISLITFNERDIVRHPLVKHIVAAYENSKKNDI
jgi:phosphate starvation-inducible PhoH-like protein